MLHLIRLMYVLTVGIVRLIVDLAIIAFITVLYTLILITLWKATMRVLDAISIRLTAHKATYTVRWNDPV